MKKIEFEGHTFEYDPDVFQSYKVVRAMSQAGSNLSQAFVAMDAIFAGKADEYAELLGDSMDKMGELVQAITSSLGTSEKN